MATAEEANASLPYETNVTSSFINMHTMLDVLERLTGEDRLNRTERIIAKELVDLIRLVSA